MLLEVGMHSYIHAHTCGAAGSSSVRRRPTPTSYAWLEYVQGVSELSY